MANFKIKTVFDSQPFWQQVLLVLLFNTLIAAFIKALERDIPFINQFINSQSIGVSILLTYLITANFIELKSWRMVIPLFIGSVLGVTVAITINAILAKASFERVINAVENNVGNIATTFFIALFFGAIIVLFFSHREKILATKTRLQEEEIRNLDSHKKIAETNLRMLQAQIEPHFLFNTLSNVISLIDSDPRKSKSLLESLTTFLRATLKRSSDEKQTLAAEINLVKNYLDIMQIRMGNRLRYQINCQDDVLDARFPPLLLQPLVENAIIHGIEPLAEGGQIEIDISKDNALLRLKVSDSGRGLQMDNPKGFGLGNIRDRINSIYAEQGRIVIEENQPRGVIVSMEVPYAQA